MDPWTYQSRALCSRELHARMMWRCRNTTKQLRKETAQQIIAWALWMTLWYLAFYQ